MMIKNKEKVFFDKQPKLPNILSKWETFVSNGNSHNIDLLFFLLCSWLLCIYFLSFIKAYLRSSVVSLSDGPFENTFDIQSWAMGKEKKRFFSCGIFSLRPSFFQIFLSPLFPLKKKEKPFLKKMGSQRRKCTIPGPPPTFFSFFHL